MSTLAAHGPQVFIVEDETLAAMDLANSLKDLGYSIAGQAETVEHAIREVEQTQPDIVLIDIKLKGSGDGFAAADLIRERWNIPVVFVTANTDADMIARAKASGPYDFLSKPFRPRDLDATIGIALHQHKFTRALFAERGWFTLMMASLSDGVIATDAKGFIRYMNPPAEALIGWSASDALGLPIERVSALSNLANQPVEQCQLRKALASREPVRKERFLVQGKGDDRKSMEVSASPIIEGGQLIGAVTIFLDISDRLAQERYDNRLREQLQEQVHVTNEALGDTRQVLQALSHHLLSAQEEERARIARELHDDLGQRSALLGMKIESLELEAPANLKPRVASARQDLIDLSNGLRRVSHQLHPSIIADLGLAPALDSLVTDFRDQGLSAELQLEEVLEPSLEIATALYRITQEALQNVKKHCPGAPVQVRLWRETNTLHLSIQDRGSGFPLPEVREKGGLGLVSMQERARLIGGAFC